MNRDALMTRVSRGKLRYLAPGSASRCRICKKNYEGH